MGKKIALVQWAASAARIAGVFFGQGPSSKVSTTSPGRRKSWLLKCSKPNCGPPVVSISTTRDTPNALGLPGQEEVAGGADAAAGTAVAAGIGARAGAAWAVTSAAAAVVASAGPAGGGAFDSSISVTTVRIGSAGAAGADAAATGSEVFCERMAPNAATHTIITSVNAAVMRRIAVPPAPDDALWASPTEPKPICLTHVKWPIRGGGSRRSGQKRRLSVQK